METPVDLCLMSWFSAESFKKRFTEAHKVENFPTWQLVVAGALQGKDSRWLMHKRPEEKHHGGLWEFPGGKVENGENPPFALVRELQEELGIEIDPSSLLPATFAHESASVSRNSIVILLYIVRDWTGTPRSHEGGLVDWFDPLEIAKLPKPPLDSDLVSQLFKLDRA